MFEQGVDNELDAVFLGDVLAALVSGDNRHPVWGNGKMPQNKRNDALSYTSTSYDEDPAVERILFHFCTNVSRLTRI